MAHTQGEWRYFKANDGHIIKTDKGCIVDVYCNVDDLDSTEEANAKLIAAAPELLEALESMKIQLGIWNKQSEDTVGYKWAQKAINAINKATK